MKNNMQKICQGRSQVYFFLANVFAKEPTKKFLEELHSPETIKLMEEHGIRIDLFRKGKSLGQLAEDIACEYARLFVGPAKHLAPNESIVRGEGRYWGESTVACMEAYEANGFKVDTTRFKDMPDHLSVELEFMGHLVCQEEGLSDGSNDPASGHKADLKKAQKKFLEEHLMAWVLDFVKELEKITEFTYYDQFGRFLIKFLDREIKSL